MPRAAFGISRSSMQDSLSISCPHCGESFSLAFDASEGSSEFTIDCEVCCRPCHVRVVYRQNGEAHIVLTALDE